jgi:hypothetical protein
MEAKQMSEEKGHTLLWLCGTLKDLLLLGSALALDNKGE